MIYCLLELNMLCDCVTRGCGDHSPLTTAAILEWRRRSAWGGAAAARRGLRGLGPDRPGSAGRCSHQKNLAHHDILLQYWHTLYACGHTFFSDTLLVVLWHTTNTFLFVNILLYSLRHTLSFLIHYMIYVDIHVKVCRQELICWDTISKVDILSLFMLTYFLNVF